MKNLCVLFIFLLLFAAAFQAEGQLRLECNAPTNSDPNHSDPSQGRMIEPRSKAELAEMSRAPHGALRTEKHLLVVHWAAGAHDFKDEPPYNAPLDGVAWTYCGYSATAGIHLIREQDEDLFTGEMVDEKTGSILPGGHAVAFSPDLKLYVAYEQPDGQDGETLKLFNRAGKLLWKGTSNISTAEGVYDFEDEYWDNSGKLIAEYKNAGGQKKAMILTPGAGGHWRWMAAAR